MSKTDVNFNEDSVTAAICRDFHVGQYIVYCNGERYELGRIKALCDNGAFVAYHEGENEAKTPYDLMHPLSNEYAIKETTLGGDYFR